MVRVPDGEKTLRICITVYTQYRRVTDRWTDGQTDRQIDSHRQTSCHGIVRAMQTRRVVKTLSKILFVKKLTKTNNLHTNHLINNAH